MNKSQIYGTLRQWQTNAPHPFLIFRPSLRRGLADTQQSNITTPKNDYPVLSA